MEKAKGPQFLRFCLPIVETLQELGGSGQPKEVTDTVLERLHISEREQAQPLKNGGSRVRNQVAWARFYLAKGDLLDASRLTPFVSFTVLFQCKRYAGAVSASQVRDFRGAMMGRADKGIIITT